MSGQLPPANREASETVEELRGRLGLFSFRQDEGRDEAAVKIGRGLELGVRAGDDRGMAGDDAGGGRIDVGTADHVAATGQSRSLGRRGPGSGILRPGLLRMGHRSAADPAAPADDPSRKRAGRSSSACDVPECRPRGPASRSGCRRPSHRRWKLAAEVGGGVGLLFRPDEARREPVWADLRLRVTPLSGGQGDARRIKIDVLYRRGGLGGSAQVWEIDHAAGDVRLVPEVAHPAAAERAARA